MNKMDEKEKKRIARILKRILIAVKLYNHIIDMEDIKWSDAYNDWAPLFYMKILSEQQEKGNVKPEFKIESKYLFKNTLEKIEELKKELKIKFKFKLIEEEKEIDVARIFDDSLYYGYRFRLYRNELMRKYMFGYEMKYNTILGVMKYINRIKFLEILKIDQISEEDLLDVLDKCFSIEEGNCWRYVEKYNEIHKDEKMDIECTKFPTNKLLYYEC
jgi:hypothetical protein